MSTASKAHLFDPDVEQLRWQLPKGWSPHRTRKGLLQAQRRWRPGVTAARLTGTDVDELVRLAHKLEHGGFGA